MRESDDMPSGRVSVVSTSRITFDLSVYKWFQQSQGGSTRAYMYVDSHSTALNLFQTHKQQT
jgi:hypothetical protein